MWFLAGRALGSLGVLVAVSLALFALVHTIPVSPARIVLGMDAAEEDVADFDHEHGLDLPLATQYARWVGGALRGISGGR